MATTTFSGPVKAGTIQNTTGTTYGDAGDVANTGWVVMSQTAAFAYNAGASNLLANLPAQSQIIDFVLSTETVFTGSSSSDSKIDIGTSSDADAYVDNLGISATARRIPLGVAAICSNWKDIGTSTKIEVDITAGSASAGTIRVTVIYAQKRDLT